MVTMNEARTDRRRLLAAGFAAAAGAAVQSVFGQVPPEGRVSLKDQLEKGLKARLPQEFAFIARVVDMVDKQQLPLELVQGTFLWAREKGKRTRYPFPYFERGLRERAAKLGITI
jgi:hypothetical protein